MISIAQVEQELHELYIAVEGTRLRDEDRKKAVELAALLNELARVVRGDRLLVDAAAGKAYVGFLAARLLGVTRAVIIERDATRLAACRTAAARLASSSAAIELRGGDVADASRWPTAAHVVVALHACGIASDHVLDAASVMRATWIFLVPCCYGAGIPFAAAADARADELGIPRHSAVRSRFTASLIDAERTLRLEAAGYEVTVVPLVPPTVTPHNLLWRARRVAEPGRMHAAAAQLERLRGG